ncbi:MAG: hypothetical protein ACO3ZW_09060 [Opitutales bacterium]
MAEAVRAGPVDRECLPDQRTLLDNEWGEFLKRENFLVGISIDGPAELHDAYRATRSGKESHAEVMRGVEVLKRHRVEFNTLTCVKRANQDMGPEVYTFLMGIGSRYLQFIPIVERLPDEEARRLGCCMTPDDEKGLNYLCSGYRVIFNKMDLYMKVMAGIYTQQQPPAAVMQLIRQKRIAKPA